MITKPKACKHDYEISGAIEEWEEKYRILVEEDKASILPEEWRMTVIKEFLCGDIKKHIDF